ncbi:unknown protein [Seminavis robusta]|uniref:Uncharacterized protein n=1 Tax=Seminavis robusta TaxID=568900 RepID=A0A9N8EPB4_9STRA|nr:unknown protein [Seminavis robusta]|eukprot:Sro1586_g284170.1 n/a (145) ;mRNA; f:3620-4054
MAVNPSTHYGQLFNQEYHDNIDFQNDFFPTVIGCLDKIPLINADNITQLPGNKDVPSYVISSGFYLVLGAVLKKRLGAKRVAFSFYNTLKQAMETVPDELPTIIQQRFDLVILGDDKELRYSDELDGLTDLPTLEQETRHYNTV